MSKTVRFGTGRTVTFRQKKKADYDSPARTARRAQKRAAKAAGRK